jgi:hypothetical protein
MKSKRLKTDDEKLILLKGARLQLPGVLCQRPDDARAFLFPCECERRRQTADERANREDRS